MDFLNHSVILAAGAVLLVQQILKLKIMPLAFANKYPVPTNIILSVVASIVVLHLSWNIHNWQMILANIGSVAVLAAISYNMLVAKWAEMKSLEGPGTKPAVVPATVPEPPMAGVVEISQEASTDNATAAPQSPAEPQAPSQNPCALVV